MSRLGQKLEEAIPILTLGAGLIALFLGIEWWWMIFVVGWVVLTPLVSVLVDEPVERAVKERIRDGIEDAVQGGRDEPADGLGIDDREDALDVLRERYARGELDDVEFERKVERLLETETVADAEALLGERSGGATGDRERERESET